MKLKAWLFMIETQLSGIMGYVKQISATNDLLGAALSLSFRQISIRHL